MVEGERLKLWNVFTAITFVLINFVFADLSEQFVMLRDLKEVRLGNTGYRMK